MMRTLECRTLRITVTAARLRNADGTDDLVLTLQIKHIPILHLH